MLLAEMIDEVKFPSGVFNLVNGDGPGVGTDLSGHPDVDMISFTGSTRAGKLITKNAAETVAMQAIEIRDSAISSALSRLSETLKKQCYKDSAKPS